MAKGRSSRTLRAIPLSQRQIYVVPDITHTLVDVSDHVFGSYTTPSFKQCAKRWGELVLKALGIPGQLRRASHVLLWKVLPLLGLGRHNARASSKCRERCTREDLDKMSQDSQERLCRRKL
jgi:hypothetical protein